MSLCTNFISILFCIKQSVIVIPKFAQTGDAGPVMKLWSVFTIVFELNSCCNCFFFSLCLPEVNTGVNCYSTNIVSSFMTAIIYNCSLQCCFHSRLVACTIEGLAVSATCLVVLMDRALLLAVFSGIYMVLFDKDWFHLCRHSTFYF